LELLDKPKFWCLEAGVREVGLDILVLAQQEQAAAVVLVSIGIAQMHGSLRAHLLFK
jgi:hypothetical protein